MLLKSNLYFLSDRQFPILNGDHIVTGNIVCLPPLLGSTLAMPLSLPPPGAWSLSVSQ